MKFTFFFSISFVNIPCIYLIFYIIQNFIIPIGNNDLRFSLKFLKIIYYRASKERTSIIQSRFINNDRGAFRLDSLHNSLNTALTMLIGKNLALMVSPLVPATYLAIGLTGTELKDHMKFSIPPYYVVSLIMLVLGVILGIISL